MTKPRILIVEDEPFVVRDIRQQLVELGYDPVADTPLGESAVAMAGELRPDLVLMDIHLEGELDGISAARTIRDRFDLPVVFLTAFAGDETVDRAKKSDPFGYIIKPFDERELHTVIEMALYKHQAESQLRKGREEQAAILRTTMDGFWLTDTEGRILEVNEACCRMHGYSHAEMMGKSIADFEADESAEEIAGGIEQLRQTGSALMERRHRCKDGRLIDVEVSISYLPGETGRFSAFIRDITNRKQLEVALRRSEERASKAFRTIPDGLVISRLADGRVLEVNEGFCRLSGLSREQVIGRTMPELNLWDDLSAREKFIGALLQQGSVRGMEAGFHNQSGDRRIIALSAELMDHDQDRLVLTVTRDVTEQKHKDDELRQALESLRRSETKFRTLYDSDPDGVMLLDEKGYFDCNSAALEMFGCASPQEFFSKHPVDVSPAFQPNGMNSRESANQKIAAALEAGTQRFEWMHKRADTGATFPAEVLLNAMELDGRRILQAVVRDITERKRAEETLRESEETYRSILDASPEDITITDMEGRILLVSPAANSMFGYEPGEEIGKSLFDFIVPEDAERAASNIRIMDQEGPRRPNQYRGVRKDRSILDIEVNSGFIRGIGGQPTKMVFIVRDISERRRAEDALRTSEERFKTMFMQAPLGIAFMDSLTGRLQQVNPRFALIAGRSMEELAELDWMQITHPDDLQADLNNMAQLNAGKINGFRMEKRYVHPDGTVVWIVMTIAPLLDEDTDHPRHLAMIQDITERKQAEQALQESERSLIESQRISGLGSYLLDTTTGIWKSSDVLDGIFGIDATYSHTIDTWASLIHDEDREWMVEYFQNEVIGKRGRFDKEYRIIKSDDKAERWVHGLGELEVRAEDRHLMMHGTIQDITERKRADQALVESHERFELANRATFNVIWDWDLKTNAFWRNDNFQKMFGYARNEVETSFESSTSRIHPDDLESVRAGIKVSIENPSSEFWADQYRFRRKDGSYAFVEDRAVITRDAAGHAVRMLGAMQDISERKQAERALRESEEKLRVIIEHSRQLFYSHTPDNVITYVSPQVREFFDADPEDTYRPWTDFLTENPVNAIGLERSRLALATGRQQQPYELEMLSPHGRKIWVEVHESPVLENGEVVAMVGALTDITESKHAQDQLRLQGSALEAAANAITITDRKGLIQWINPAFTDLTGYSVSEAIGLRPGDLVKSGKHDQTFYVDLWTTLLDGQVWRGEITNRRKDGSLYIGEKIITPLKDNQGRITHFTSVEQDITERKRAEASLRLQGGALEAAANAILITDHEGVIEWANAAFTSFTGYEVSEAVGKRPGDLLKSGMHDQAYYKAMWEALDAGGVWQGEIINKRKDGSLYTEDMSITPLRNDGGEITHFIAVKQDISQRKQAEAQLSHLNRSLKMLSACNEALVRGDDERELLQVICQIAIDIGGYRMAWVGYALDDADRSIKPIAFAGEEQGYLSEIKVTWSESDPAGMGPAGRAIRSGQPSVFEDVAEAPAAFYWLKAMQQRGFRGTISLPLRSGNRTFGVFTLYSADPFHLPDEDLELLQEMADDLAFGISNIRAQLERKQMQQAVLKMAQGVSGGTTAASGEAFFDLMVASLTEAVHADGGFIGRLSGAEGGSLQTVSFVAAAQKRENFAYALAGTPCELVAAGETCLFDREVRSLFPKDQIAVDFGVEAYAGEPLFDSKGQVLGLLAVYFGKPVENPELVKSTLRIFASRAAGELERQDTDSRIREQASLLDKAHDAIMVRDMDHRILFWNKGAEQLYGWKSEEVMGRSVADIAYTDLAIFQEAQRLVLAEGEWNGRILHRRKDGNLLTTEDHWTLVRDEHDRPRSVLAINTDITERVEAEVELHQYTERLEAMREIDVALLGARSTEDLAHGALSRLRHIVPFERAAVVLFDQSLAEGTILAVDQDTPWLPIPGEVRPISDFHDLKDLLSAPFLDLPDLSEISGCILEELLLSQGLRNLVYIPMESEGAVLGFLALSATMPGMLTPQHAEIALDMTDQLVVAIQHTRMREELEVANQMLESKVEMRTSELRSTVATLQVLEAELRQKEAEARAASEAKSTFLSSMSHELRTPLIGITGMLEVLAETHLGPEQRQVVEVINESSDTLLRIIGDILDFSKIEANKLELSPHAFSAQALLQSISHTFKSAVSSKGLKFILEVDPNLAPAHVADALRIRQILNNFMSNAVKFTEKGSITLRAVLLESHGGSQSLAFEVQDTGIGVSPENLVKLFEPFTQAEASTTRRFGGTGLGLAISRRLAGLMGGSLNMQSVLGQGTTITLEVELPVGNERDVAVSNVIDVTKAPPTRPAPTIEAAEAERTLVLLAEDHPTNRIVLTQQINRAGYALEVAVDGQDAFEKWLSGRYALLLTDLHMPRMDGYQLTQAVRDWEHAHQSPRMPILALTANALVGEAERCLELGLDDYLVKPVTIPLLASKLRQWMPHAKFDEAPEEPAALQRPNTGPAPGLDSRALLELCSGNAEAAQEVLDDFIATTQADLRVMQSGLEKKDRPCIVRQSHRIKGSSAMIGARDLAARATELEAYAGAGTARWETIQDHLAGLQAALGALGRIG